MIRFKNFKAETKKNLIFKILILAILFFLAFLVGRGNFKIAQKREIAKERLISLKEELAELSKKRAELQSKISQSETPEYLERVAREELNLKKIGEKIVAFPILKEKEEEERNQEKNLWQKFLEKFKIK